MIHHVHNSDDDFLFFFLVGAGWVAPRSLHVSEITALISSLRKARSDDGMAATQATPCDSTYRTAQVHGAGNARRVVSPVKVAI